MNAQKHRAIAALRTTFGRITPENGYHHDISGVIYPVLVVPERLPFQEIAGETWVYVCVPLVQDSVRYEQRGTLDVRTFTLRAYGFVREMETDPLLSTTVERLAKLEDDLIRSVMSNPKLDGTVQECRPVSSESHGGWPSRGKRYGELEVVFSVRQSVSVAQLSAVA